MVDSSKITEKASELAGQAAQAAGPALERAKEVATDLVGKVAETAGPLVGKAAQVTATGVATAAEQVDKVTKGKYSDQISSVSSKIESKLDPKP